MDLQSILGYSKGSPFANNPYLDINSNVITMANTPMDLVGIDNLGNKKKMKAGRKTPYIFPGNKVRESPMQTGGYSNVIPGKKAYNPNMAAKDTAFQNWYTSQTREGLAGIPYVPSETDYDYYSYFRNGDYTGHNLNNHYPDTYKLPNHQTFSNESIFSGNGAKGYWKGDTFIKYASGGPTASKAAEMLKDGTAHKRPLTKKQKHYFQALAHGWNPSKQKGGYSAQDIYKFLFPPDEEEDYSKKEENDNTAPTEEQVDNATQQMHQDALEEDDTQAMQIAMGGDDGMSPAIGAGMLGPVQFQGNPYVSHNIQDIGNSKETPHGSGADYAFQYYKSKGLAPHIAAGIVGNLIQESGNFRDDVVSGKTKGDSGLATGIAQWHGDRWKGLEQWAKANGKNPYSLDAQLDYVLEEPGIGQKTLQAMQNTTNSADAANVFGKMYERPAFLDKNRANNAKALYPYQKGGTYSLPYETLMEMKKQGYKFKLL